jgi:hypothetical protein
MGSSREFYLGSIPSYITEELKYNDTVRYALQDKRFNLLYKQFKDQDAPYITHVLLYVLNQSPLDILQHCEDGVIPASCFDDVEHPQLKQGLTIPENIKYIGERAFSYCYELSSITLPKGLEVIGDNVFQHCLKLQEITIPASVHTVGKTTFQYCTNLEKITFEGDKLDSIPPYFCDRTRLTSIVIPRNVKVICNDAFARCGQLTDITIPKDIQEIQYCAFDGVLGLTLNYPGEAKEFRDKFEDKFDQIFWGCKVTIRCSDNIIKL